MGNRQGTKPTTAPQSEYQDYNYQYKIVLLGGTDTGKNNYVRKLFGLPVTAHDSNLSSLGIDFRIVHINLDDTVFRVFLWIASPDQRYSSLVARSCREAHGFLIFFNLSNPKSYDMVSQFVTKAQSNGPPGAPVMLLGSVSDMGSAWERVAYETAKDYAETRNLLYFEVSAQEGTNIELSVVNLVANVRKKELVSQAEGLEDEQSGLD